MDDCVGAYDDCGVCNGPGSVYECGCADIPEGDCDCDGNQLDALGVCGGACAADADADGICDDVDDCVGAYDDCGVCNGPGSVYECGCADIPEGDCDCDGNQLDALGVCGGACAADADADGICDDVDDCVGAYDDCGVCNGPGAIYECGCSDIPEAGFGDYSWLDLSAYASTAEQSTESPWNEPASNAVDGDLDTYSHTACDAPGDQWWQISLGGEREVTEVSITPRQNCCHERINGARVEVDGVVCAEGLTLGNDINAPILAVCPTPLVGSVVRIVRPGASWGCNVLHIAEVGIYASGFEEEAACDCDGNVLDAIGVCGGACTTDADADGICDDVDDCVGAYDDCGVCNGPGSVYECGCADIPEGDCDCDGNQLDALGVCGGACAADADADGICDDVDDCVGAYDDCGVCNGPGAIYECGCSDLPSAGFGDYSWLDLSAYASTAEQSTESPWNEPASNAVDGDLDTYSHTACDAPGDQWWQISLGGEREVTEVSITPRQNCCHERINGARVEVDGVVCAEGLTLGNDINAPILAVCPTPLVGSVVRIVRPGASWGCNVLHIAEVGIYASGFEEEAACDCDGNVLDAIGVCGGACAADADADGICDDVDDCVGAYDDCGICGGDGSSCAGCTDNLACNYDCTAEVDDGSCILPEFGRNCDGECWGTDMGSSVYESYDNHVQLWSFYNGSAGTYMVPESELPYSLEWHVNGEVVATSYPSEVCSQDEWGDPTNCIQATYGYGPGWQCWEDWGEIESIFEGPTLNMLHIDVNTLDWYDTLAIELIQLGPAEGCPSVIYSTDFDTGIKGGCTDNLACNYDCTAEADDGSCILPEFGRNCDGECWGTDMGSSVYESYDNHVQLWSFYNGSAGTYMVPESELPYSLEWHVNGEVVATSYPSEVCSQDEWGDPTNCIQATYGYGPGWQCWEDWGEIESIFEGPTLNMLHIDVNTLDWYDTLAIELIQLGPAEGCPSVIYSTNFDTGITGGCTDNLACNYNSEASEDDGSCVLPNGCTDSVACNYSSAATCDDGSCTYFDALGVCGGSCEADADSDGICDDVDDCVGAYDDCGVCNGPGSVYECGCADIPEGDCDCDGNQLDALGVCGGACAADADADGICDDVDDCVGAYDDCGVCNGPGSVYECGCADIPEGDCDCDGNQLDALGVCGGACAADADADGICDDVDDCVGAYDDCGVCNGPGSVYECGCADIPEGDCDCDGNQLDALGVCGGACAADADADGICDDVDDCVGAYDDCGVCNGPGSVYECGCADIPEGDCDCDGNQLDALGVCGGACAADADADGICDDVDDCVGAYDDCGVCNGPGSVYECGCADIPEGDCDCDGNQLDALGVCGGDLCSGRGCRWHLR